MRAKKDNLKITNLSYVDLLKSYGSQLKDCMVYLDPPYLSSDSSYGRIAYLGKWDAKKEKEFYAFKFSC